MARAETTKLYRTFVKGFITEAGPLTYPEDASIAEDNCVIYRTGNRSRRLGIDLESYGSSFNITVPVSTYNNYAISEYRWDAVDNRADLTFAVVQVGLTVHFFDITNNDIVMNGEKAFSLDLTPYVVSGTTNPESYPVCFSAGRGYLFIVGEKLEPLLLQYNSGFDSIAVSRIYIQIRDFKGLADNLANDEEPTTLTKEHHYNLRNQGWVDPDNSSGSATVSYFSNFGGVGSYTAPASTPITTYHTAVSRYPSNNKQWWVAKNSSGDFDPALLNKFGFGSSRAPRGHYIVDAFNIDRSAVSGVAGIPIETSRDRPLSVAFANGRAFYGVNSNIYFTQVMDDKRKAGFCYQDADPTSEDISDLIATDGGVIPIPEMSRLVKLLPVGAGIIVFATNGVWFISGTQAGFTALDISVSKISPIGTESPNSIVEVNGQIYWWSRIGIMALSQKSGMFGPIDGAFDNLNITEQTIQTFYNDISDEAKRYVKAVYDPQTNVIQWLYKSDQVTQTYAYDKVLTLDLTLQAFYPWSVSYGSHLPFIAGVITSPILAGYDGPLNTSIKKTSIKYLCWNIDTPLYRINFAQSKSLDFIDWQTWTEGRGLPDETYMSFVETGYELMEDAMRKKQTPFIFTYFRRTEEDYIEDGEDWSANRQSSCLFQVKWGWASSPVSNKYSTKREAYRIVRQPFFDEDDTTFDTGFPVVVTKHKVRGSGKAIQFRFESDAARRDFDLLGWATNITGNTKP